jgi:hypothetical protein
MLFINGTKDKLFPVPGVKDAIILYVIILFILSFCL